MKRRRHTRIVSGWLDESDADATMRLGNLSRAVVYERFSGEPFCFRRHRSIPSALISCISGDRSEYSSAAKGFAEITAPVS